MAGTLPTFDYESEQAQLLRQQRIAEAMLQGGLTPIDGSTQTIGGYAVKKSPLEAIAKVAQVYSGLKQQQKAGDQQKDLAQRYKADLSSGLERYMTTMNGGTASIPGGEGTDAYGGQVDYKPDPRKAVIEALGSNHPVLQRLGEAQLKAQMSGNGQIGAKDLLPYINPNQIPALLTQGTSAFQPKKNIKEAGNVVYDADTMQVQQLKGGYDPKSIVKIDGDTYQINPSTQKLEKMDNAPKTNVTTNVGGPSVMVAGQKEGAKTVFQEYGKRVEKLGEIAQSATNNLQAMQEMKNLEQKGIFSNVSSGPATFMANLGQQLGIPVDTNKLGNTEGFRAVATDLWQGVVSKYGGNRGVTQEEAKELKNIIPQAANSPEARAKMFAILERAAQRQIQQYQNAHTQYLKAVQADDVTQIPQMLMESQLPAPTTPNPATPAGKNKPTVSNW